MKEKNFKEIAAQYSDKITGLKDNNEGQLIFHVISSILEELGYQKDNFFIESTAVESRKRMDMLIKDRNGTDLLVVEAKKASNKLKQLNQADIEQLLLYMNLNKLEWGILTNGLEWKLINKQIDGYPNQMVVYSVRLNHNKPGDSNPINLKYFTYEALVNSKITKFHAYLQQFKVYSFEEKNSSYPQYKSAIKSLTEFISMYYPSYELDMLNYHHFIEYLKWYVERETHKSKAGRKIAHQTVENQFRYLKRFYKVMKDNHKLKNDPLESIKLNEIMIELEGIMLESRKADYNDLPLIIKNTYKIIKEQREGLRNRLIFSLLLYGLDRVSISNLEEADFIKEKCLLRIGGEHERFIHLTENLFVHLNEYLQYRQNKKIKSKWLICKSKGEKVNEKTISYVINDEALKKVANITIEEIHQHLIPEWVKRTGDVISIAYLKGLTLGRMDSFF